MWLNRRLAVPQLIFQQDKLLEALLAKPCSANMISGLWLWSYYVNRWKHINGTKCDVILEGLEERAFDLDTGTTLDWVRIRLA
jgi:hypothetical protein